MVDLVLSVSWLCMFKLMASWSCDINS